jgi:arabinosaccharide transport system substrate-binding protein
LRQVATGSPAVAFKNFMKRHLAFVLTKFPFGTAPLVVFAVTLLSGLWVAAHPIPPSTATARIWTFSAEHVLQYEEASAAYGLLHPGASFEVKNFEYRAMATRLRSAFWADLDVPELVEMNSSRAAVFFAGPVEDVGFVDLRERLHSSGLFDRMVRGRLDQFTNRGRIFGMPHDVHPVLIAYRKDIFDAEGIDASQIETWDDFIRVGRRLRRLPGEHPDGPRYIIQMPRAEGWGVEILIIQRGGGYFDAEGHLTLDSEEVVQTIKMYVPMVAGPDRIAADVGVANQLMTVKSMEEGRTLGFLAPDWRSRAFENDMPRLKGKMALMPLPAFTRGGRRTSTWGGTMLGIPKNSKSVERAWEVAQYLYDNPANWERQWRQTGILPAVRDAWKLPAFQERSAYWSNQMVAEEYAKVADDVPPRYSHPQIELAETKLTQVTSAAMSYYEEHGEQGFEAYIRLKLRQVAGDVRRQMQRNPF